MIGTPRSFARTPDLSRGGYDVLAEMLRPCA
jgi:hypothetical protein